MKKNIRTIKVSNNNGKADIRDETKTLKPSILVIVLNGLKTLKTLKLEMFMLDEPRIYT